MRYSTFMARVSVQKEEYEQLKRQASAYRNLASRFFAALADDPVEAIVKDFRATKKYSKSFLKDLESGLRKSSLAKKRR